MADQAEILLIEDTITMQIMYASILKKAGHEADCASAIGEARAFLAKRTYPMILLDLTLPDGDGLELLDEILHAGQDTKIIVITANGSLNKAIEAMRSGAFDFLVKPFSADKLIASVDRAIEAMDPSLAPHSGGAQLQERFVGTSKEIKGLRDRIAKLSRTDVWLFVCGEEGLDKDYFAALLHKNSPYGDGPLVELDCSARGARARGEGLFSVALPQLVPSHEASAEEILDHLRGGTLILKEVCDLDMAQQLELLRFLQCVGNAPDRQPEGRGRSVRVISTSTRDPLAEARAGRFRQDLLARLYSVPLTVPPLRQRKDDIVPFAESFLRLLAMRRDRPVPVLSQAAKDLITEYSWPRNTKQLQAVLETAVSFYAADVIEPHMLGDEIVQHKKNGNGVLKESPHGRIAADLAVENLVGMSLSEVEQRFIEATIERCNGSIPKAAEILNVAPSTLYRKLESWQNSTID